MLEDPGLSADQLHPRKARALPYLVLAAGVAVAAISNYVFTL